MIALEQPELRDYLATLPDEQLGTLGAALKEAAERLRSARREAEATAQRLAEVDRQLADPDGDRPALLAERGPLAAEVGAAPPLLATLAERQAEAELAFLRCARKVVWAHGEAILVRLNPLLAQLAEVQRRTARAEALDKPVRDERMPELRAERAALVPRIQPLERDLEQVRRCVALLDGFAHRKYGGRVEVAVAHTHPAAVRDMGRRELRRLAAA